MKKIIKTTVSLVLSVCLIFSIGGCSQPKKNENVQSSEIETVKEYSSQDFDEYLKELYVDIMEESDLISIHSYMEHPSDFGVNNYSKNLGRIDYDNLGSAKNYEEILNELNKYDVNTLNEKQKITYNELYKMFTNEKNNADLYLLSTDITPTIGIHVQLPLLFAEYSFVEKKDIDEYLLLVADVDDYFNDILKYEKLRADAGYFLSDDLADEVINSCNSFKDEALNDDGVMIASFNERIDKFSGLTEEEKTKYKQDNYEAVKSNVVKGYEELASGLAALKGTNKYSGGICNYPNGSRYFEYLVNKKLGWGESVNDLFELGEDYVDELLDEMSKIIYSDYSISSKMSTFSFGMSDPVAMIEDLKSKISVDFPEIKETSYNVSYVTKSLEDYASPAMYFIPQLDNADVNSIYINNAGREEIYPTIAHEGYPGHLYQTQYFINSNPYWIRYVLAPRGYMEGWASYVEVLSYSFANTGNESLNKIMGLNYETTLIVYALGDIGVNYLGWDYNKMREYVGQYFNFSEASYKNMYNAFIANPGNYTQYAFGMIGIFELREKAKDELGSKFNLKEFHRYILDMGPIQFDILFDNLEPWINSF